MRKIATGKRISAYSVVLVAGVALVGSACDSGRVRGTRRAYRTSISASTDDLTPKGSTTTTSPKGTTTTTRPPGATTTTTTAPAGATTTTVTTTTSPPPTTTTTMPFTPIPFTGAPLPSASHLRFFGYYGPGELGSEKFNQTLSHTNLIVNAGDPQDAHVREFERLGFKYNIDMWGDLPAGADWDRWVAKVSLYRPYIAAINLGDELPCDSATVARLDAKIARIKSAFPDLPTWVNYIGNRSFSTALLNPIFDCRIPRGLDWVSIDYYGTWEYTQLPTVLTEMAMVLEPHQMILLVPPGFQQKPGAPGFDPTTQHTEAAMIDIAMRSYQIALDNPRIVGMMPWTWDKGPDSPASYATAIYDLPELRAAFMRIGGAITRRYTSGPYTGGGGGGTTGGATGGTTGGTSGGGVAPAPSFSSLSPAVAPAGQAFTLTINGANFVKNPDGQVSNGTSILVQ